MEPEKDKWIAEVFDSLNGMQRAEPGPFLFAKIQHRLAGGISPVYVPARTVWLAVASFALLVLLNWRMASQPIPTASNNTELNTVISGMQLYPDSNQPYDLWSGQNY